ncbi:N-acetylmuramoyl-L-alanine amidase [Priestia endophytica]|uniref:N-acetylmuramoyl-L-alanine amidase n=1 Tax=Priestia endophytica TaxID=135735 RepID=UPI00227E16CF|nr:N-acetylmuramoyl-L-alanine amidase [Priestia endophytica]MCY8233363.1 N-acetylmuramoyl-L-alanine amidase [Priestia endophytica]
MSLRERARKANNWGADLFVSVHINAGGGTGLESYTYPGTTGATKQLQKSLHEEVLLTMKAFGQVLDRGQKEAHGRGIAKYLGLKLVGSSIHSSKTKPVKPEINQKEQEEEKRKMSKFIGEYQMNQLETIYREARQAGLLEDERWERKVSDKSITVGGVTLLPSILTHQLKSDYVLKE